MPWSRCFAWLPDPLLKSDIIGRTGCIESFMGFVVPVYLQVLRLNGLMPCLPALVVSPC